SRVTAWARVAGSTLAAVSRWANGLRSLPTPTRPSAQAWSGVVPRPENGSSTTSPGREYRAMKAWLRAAGKLARYEHIGWNAWPHSRCWSFHSGAMARIGSSGDDAGTRSSASWAAAVALRGVVIPGSGSLEADGPRSIARATAGIGRLGRWPSERRSGRAHTTTPRPLGHDETDVGPRDDVEEVIAVGAHRGTARRHPRRQRRAIQAGELQERNRGPDLPGDGARLIDAGAVQHREEFLAAVAAHDVAATEPPRQEVGKGPQDRVAGLVTVLLVEGPEVVEVEDHDRRAAPVVGIASHAGGLETSDRRVEVAAVEEAGQRVADRELGHLGVEERVRDRQGHEPGKDRNSLQVVRAEGAIEVAADEGHRANDHVVADQRDGGARNHVRRASDRNRNGIRGRVVV